MWIYGSAEELKYVQVVARKRSGSFNIISE